MTFQLIKRGYSYKNLRKISHAIGQIDREKLLKYKENLNQFQLIDNKTFIFKTIFDSNIPKLKSCINGAFLATIAQKKDFAETKLKIINKIQPNIGQMLIHNKSPPFFCKYFCSSCFLKGCKLCKFVNNNYKISINKEFQLPILSNSNCKMKNSIYIIYCKLCHKFYVGQTENISTRMLKHIYDITSFKPFISKKAVVAIHFNFKRHIFLRDFSFFILESNINDKLFRLSTESFYINLIYNIDKSLLLNDFIPHLYIKHDDFS